MAKLSLRSEFTIRTCCAALMCARRCEDLHLARTDQRLRDVARAVSGIRRDQIIIYALTRAWRAVPDLDQTLANHRN